MLAPAELGFATNGWLDEVAADVGLEDAAAGVPHEDADKFESVESLEPASVDAAQGDAAIDWKSSSSASPHFD